MMGSTVLACSSHSEVRRRNRRRQITTATTRTVRQATAYRTVRLKPRCRLEAPLKLSLLFVITLSLAVIACGDKDDAACETEGAYQCDGTMLQICDVDLAWQDDTECGEMGMECHAEMGHCMDMDGEDSGMMEM